jgi:hypothetical protein
MWKLIQTRRAEARFYRAAGDLIAYSRRPSREWHPTVHDALRRRRDRLADEYAAAVAAA